LIKSNSWFYSKVVPDLLHYMLSRVVRRRVLIIIKISA